MSNQSDIFDEVSRLRDAFETVKPHLSEEDYSKHKENVLTNYKLHMSGTFNTTLNKVVKEAMDIPKQPDDYEVIPDE